MHLNRRPYAASIAAPKAPIAAEDGRGTDEPKREEMGGRKGDVADVALFTFFRPLKSLPLKSFP